MVVELGRGLVEIVGSSRLWCRGRFVNEVYDLMLIRVASLEICSVDNDLRHSTICAQALLSHMISSVDVSWSTSIQLIPIWA